MGFFLNCLSSGLSCDTLDSNAFAPSCRIIVSNLSVLTIVAVNTARACLVISSSLGRLTNISSWQAMPLFLEWMVIFAFGVIESSIQSYL